MTDRNVDGLTGMRVEVEMTVDLPLEAMWDLASDVVAAATHSPECVAAEWLDGANRPPRPGDRFAGRNRYPDGAESRLTCEVTEVGRPHVFAWAVLDEDERPASIWRYELAEADEAGRTLVRHSFVHGPGRTKLRALVEERPEILAKAIEIRGGMLRANMTATLRAMTGTPEPEPR